jgi:hypothetical protein
LWNIIESIIHAAGEARIQLRSTDPRQLDADTAQAVDCLQRVDLVAKQPIAGVGEDACHRARLGGGDQANEFGAIVDLGA